MKFNPYRFLFFRIFIWFWLTLVATIGLLLFLSNLPSNELSHEPLRGPMKKNLHYLAKHIERRANKSHKPLSEIVKHPRVGKHQLLYIAAETPEASFFNQALEKPIDPGQLHFSKTLKPQVIFTENYQAFGPEPIKVNQKTYWIYQINPHKKFHMLGNLRRMPNSIKLIIALIASFSLSLLFSRTLIKPINALKKAAFEIASGNLSSRIETNQTRHDELGELTQDFNKMAHKLELLMNSQKRLLADISHELRSPLTRLQMATGLAQMQSKDDDNSHLKRVEQEAAKLDAMIADVLKLSRFEAHEQELNLEYQNFSLVLDQVISDAKFESQQLNKTLEVNGEQTAELSFDAQVMASAIENILRNAIKYANNLISVTIQQTTHRLLITICDDGPGVPGSELDALFEPFYRISQSRTRNSGGTGLGLAISKHAIKAHNGEITLSNQNNSGLCVLISLPIQTTKTSTPRE